MFQTDVEKLALLAMGVIWVIVVVIAVVLEVRSIWDSGIYRRWRSTMLALVGMWCLLWLLRWMRG